MELPNVQASFLPFHTQAVARILFGQRHFYPHSLQSPEYQVFGIAFVILYLRKPSHCYLRKPSHLLFEKTYLTSSLSVSYFGRAGYAALRPAVGLFGGSLRSVPTAPATVFANALFAFRQKPTQPTIPHAFRVQVTCLSSPSSNVKKRKVGVRPP